MPNSPTGTPAAGAASSDASLAAACTQRHVPRGPDRAAEVVPAASAASDLAGVCPCTAGNAWRQQSRGRLEPVPTDHGLPHRRSLVPHGPPYRTRSRRRDLAGAGGGDGERRGTEAFCSLPEQPADRSGTRPSSASRRTGPLRCPDSARAAPPRSRHARARACGRLTGPSMRGMQRCRTNAVMSLAHWLHRSTATSTGIWSGI